MDENGGKGDPEGQIQNSADTAHVYGSRSTDPLAKGEHTLTGPNETSLHSVTGTSTPTARRSVQFARSEGDNDVQGQSYSRPASVLTADEDIAPKRGHFQFMSKLRAFAAAPSTSRSGPASPIGELGHNRTMSDVAGPISDLTEFRFPRPEDGGGGSDADADVESSSEAGFGVQMKKKKRKTKRLPLDLSQTTPSTPKSTLSAANSLNPIDGLPSTNGPPLTPPLHPHLREGVSEDEGRERLNRDNMWRRRSNWLQSTRGRSSTGQRADGHTSQDERRPTNLRRLTGFGGASDHGDGISGAWRRHKAERGSSLSAQKWKQIKAGFKMIGQRKKPENTVDHVKSAELLAELTSGVPAALLLASMFQRDEHGSRRIPILLEQLKVHVTDSEFDSHSSGDRHLVFRIELEYGSGMTRMKWIIHRTLKDFANLHIKYKLQIGTQRYIQLRSHDSGNQLPHFPKSAFPYMRGVRGLESDMEDEEEEAAEDTAADATSGNERSRKKKRRSSIALVRRRSSLASRLEAPTNSDRAVDSTIANKRETYPEKQRKKLESYLQKMIRFLIFRPDSNRLCKFLELSALGVRLAAEGSYHGKEGYLVIQSSKGLDFRKALSPSLVKSRHSPKWFLVRHSYIVCVDSPEEMHIYDVFLIDAYFQVQAQKVRLRDQNPTELKESAKHPQHHTLKIQNSERRMRLLARNDRQLRQFEESIRLVLETTPWAKPNRFDSFAPVRPNCFAQWLVDGRDYMWVVSRAINQAKDVIYIHDWWLSPELYMRRPAAISQKWRLDRLLQRKAQEGVKIFVIMYRNINSAIPIDSEYSKFSLLDLHPNVFVQRSPNQFRQNTFFWAHHEKLCIVDHTLAFVGGIDLCFGRWDTPQHLITDDKLTGFEMTDSPKDADHCQLWPGKDYSNPRVLDFYDLDKPYEEMYDREVVPRMAWHDISMHVVGQPARDLTRHFVQRWNYILRQRKPTRPTPFLLPPPDFNPADLEALGLDGTCEVQMVRSSSMWSTGTPDLVECSIMNAYVKMIEKSDHFVYIENQFFISSCEIEGKKIENHIGDALVERIIRAANNEEAWRAVILIPLMPGFQNTVDTEGGTSVRLIMQCQYRSICRGETSIFGRLRARGIEPEDYIQFFSLRSWGRIGPKKNLVTEQLYIHAKCMVIDDRVAIIGSANINERSMLGSRDSECAAVVRDTDLIESSMNGKPYLVGRFPHTLRMRLMREHLGFDVDEILEEYTSAPAAANIDSNLGHRPDVAIRAEHIPVDSEHQLDKEDLERRQKVQEEFLARSEEMHSFNHDVDWEQAGNPNLKSNRKLTADARVTRNEDHRKDLEGHGVDQMKRNGEITGTTGRDTFLDKNSVEILVTGKARNNPTLSTVPCDNVSEAPASGAHTRQPTAPGTPETHPKSVSMSSPRMTGQSRPTTTNATDDHIQHFSLDATQPKHTSHSSSDEPRRPILDKDCMKDPLVDSFYLDTWQAIAENNTKLFRSVFRCMPDSEVKSWKDYKEYTAYAERFADMQNNHHNTSAATQTCPRNGPSGANNGTSNGGKLGAELGNTVEDVKEKFTNHPSDKDKDQQGNLQQWAMDTNKAQLERQQEELANVEKFTSHTDAPSHAVNNIDTRSSNSSRQAEPSQTAAVPEKNIELPRSAQSEAPIPSIGMSQRRRRRATTRGSKKEFHAVDDIMDMHEAGELLNLVQGHLVLWPYEWLEREEQGGNWLYTLDQISPLEI
ncbi:Phospholipase D1 [Microsporum canis]